MSSRFDGHRSTRGFMHMKIVTSPDGRYILGQFSQPFYSIPQMIHHYTVNKLPIKGAEHMSLLYPVTNELLWCSCWRCMHFSVWIWMRTAVTLFSDMVYHIVVYCRMRRLDCVFEMDLPVIGSFNVVDL